MKTLFDAIKAVSGKATLVLMPMLLLGVSVLDPVSEAARYASNLVVNRNFSEVVPGRLYRSGELSASDLEDRIAEHDIRTVIDLRMADDTTERIRGEARVVEQSGSRYVHLRTNSSRYQTIAEARKAISVLKTAQTPVLVHCADGVHRTGVISALWLLLREGTSTDMASEQLSLKYGFFKLERSLKRFRKGRLLFDDSFFAYVESNKKKPLSWEDWVENNLQ